MIDLTDETNARLGLEDSRTGQGAPIAPCPCPSGLQPGPDGTRARHVRDAKAGRRHIPSHTLPLALRSAQ